jgi:hypothetical protein
MTEVASGTLVYRGLSQRETGRGSAILSPWKPIIEAALHESNLNWL